MSMFPGAGAVVYRNEAGEPIGWDYPSEPDPADYEDRWYDDPWADEEFDGEEPEDDDEPYVREDFGYFGDEALCGE